MELMKGRKETESESEILAAQVHVWNHTFNFTNSMSLKCAVQLGIPDIIDNHGQPMTLSELVAALPIHKTKSHHLYRLLRVLVHSGFFTQRKLMNNEEEGYSLTQASRLLLKNNPYNLRDLLLVVLDPVLTKPWHYMSSWFQTDDTNITPFEVGHGKTFWEYGSHESRLNDLFNRAMAGDSLLVGQLVIAKCKGVFKGLKSMVDVGGGIGTMAMAVAREFPDLDCTVFDLPHVAPDIQAGYKNLRYLGGNMFQAIPPADAILLKWILHDWNDEDCIKILKKCKEAITSEGSNKEKKVIIIDMVVGNKNLDKVSTEAQIFFDLEMMVIVSGRERNEKEWANLFFAAGFTHYNINPILGVRALIEVYPW